MKFNIIKMSKSVLDCLSACLQSCLLK